MHARPLPKTLISIALAAAMAAPLAFAAETEASAATQEQAAPREAASLAREAAELGTQAEQRKKSEDPWIMASSAFLDGHPDLKFRRWAMDAYSEEKFVDAFNHFKRSARYADKPSQGMVAEMLWNGKGVAQDRPLGYAWMEVAAERDYPAFALFRELYWQEMSKEERERAIGLNKEIWAEYGDDVAKERLERVMRVARRNVTGSRTGFVGNLSIEVSTPMGSRRIDATEIYADRFWEPRQYWAWQDQDWKQLGSGKVDVGPVSSTAPSTAPVPTAQEGTPTTRD